MFFRVERCSESELLGPAILGVIADLQNSTASMQRWVQTCEIYWGRTLGLCGLSS